MHVESVAPDLELGMGFHSPCSSAHLHGEPTALLVVLNRSSRTLWSFNVRGCATGSWGADCLEGGILPGASAAWEVEAGTYHLRVETADGYRLHHFGLELRAGQLARWVVEDEG